MVGNLVSVYWYNIEISLKKTDIESEIRILCTTVSEYTSLSLSPVLASMGFNLFTAGALLLTSKILWVRQRILKARIAAGVGGKGLKEFNNRQ